MKLTPERIAEIEKMETDALFPFACECVRGCGLHEYRRKDVTCPVTELRIASSELLAERRELVEENAALVEKVKRLKEELDDEKYEWGEVHGNVQIALGEGVPPMNWGCKIHALRNARNTARKERDTATTRAEKAESALADAEGRLGKVLEGAKSIELEYGKTHEPGNCTCCCCHDRATEGAHKLLCVPLRALLTPAPATGKDGG